jgi:uncharacterized protein
MIRDFVYTLKTRFEKKPPDTIQIVTGGRQVGKTTGVLQLKKLLPKYNFIYYSSDDFGFQNQEWLRQVWQDARLLKSPKVLVIDEIQNIEDWSSVVKSLWDEDKRKKNTMACILLGSSSMDIHRGLSESLAGRFELIEVDHWNYSESKELKPKITLDDYLHLGGYPLALSFDSEKRSKDYLFHSIIDAVIGKDILQNVTVKKPALFKQTFELACSYGGQVVSYNKLLGQLQEGGNIDLVKYYLSLLKKAYLIKTLEKYSPKQMVKKTSSPKLLPLATSLPSFFGLERGRLFEVAVGIELLKIDVPLYYWREGKYEVDYVLELDNVLIAVEVKSGNKKEYIGLNTFLKHFPDAKTCLINETNFVNLAKDPVEYLKKILAI